VTAITTLNVDELRPPLGLFIVARHGRHSWWRRTSLDRRPRSPLRGGQAPSGCDRTYDVRASSRAHERDRVAREGTRVRDTLLETGPAQPEALALYQLNGWMGIENYPPGAFSHPIAHRSKRISRRTVPRASRDNASSVSRTRSPEGIRRRPGPRRRTATTLMLAARAAMTTRAGVFEDQTARRFDPSEAAALRTARVWFAVGSNSADERTPKRSERSKCARQRLINANGVELRARPDHVRS